MKVAIVGGMKELVSEYSQVARSEGFEVTNKLYGKWDLLHLIYPLSKQGIQQLVNSNGRQKILLHFQGDDTRPRNPFHYFLLKRVLGTGSVCAYSTSDLSYNLDWLAPDLEQFYLPVPIDTNKFKPLGLRRTHIPLVSGELSRIKHWGQRFEELKEKRFDVLDWGVDREHYKAIAPSFARFVHKRGYDEMPKYLNKRVFVVPQASKAFELMGVLGRSELEALACECRLVGFNEFDRESVLEEHGFEVVGGILSKIYDEVYER